MVRARFETGGRFPQSSIVEARGVLPTPAREVDALLADADALVLPTLPIVAPLLGAGDITIDPARGRPDAGPLRDAQAHAAVQPDRPSRRSRCPLPRAGLPVGLQLVGRRDDTPASWRSPPRARKSSRMPKHVSVTEATTTAGTRQHLRRRPIAGRVRAGPSGRRDQCAAARSRSRFRTDAAEP